MAQLCSGGPRRWRRQPCNHSIIHRDPLRAFMAGDCFLRAELADSINGAKATKSRASVSTIPSICSAWSAGREITTSGKSRGSYGINSSLLVRAVKVRISRLRSSSRMLNFDSARAGSSMRPRRGETDSGSLSGFLERDFNRRSICVKGHALTRTRSRSAPSKTTASSTVARAGLAEAPTEPPSFDN